MENRLPLQVRVIASINEAERLSALLQPLKKPETAMVAFKLLLDWDAAARQAIHLCRLATLALPRDELDNLIDRVRALDEERDLWEHYVLASWYGEWFGDFPEEL